MRANRIPALLLFSMGLFSLAAFSPTAHAQQLEYCKADAERLCKGVKLGDGRMLDCLKTHENDLTVGCAKELKALKAKLGK
jgi:hypothetical protein